MASIIKWSIKLLKWLSLSILVVVLFAMLRPIIWIVVAVFWWTFGFSGPPFEITFPGVCRSGTLDKVSTPGGLDFEFVYTDCDIVAKEETKSILLSRGPRLVKRFDEAEILRYDGSDVPPTITTIDAHAVRISIDRVSSVAIAKDRWNDISIVYDIGRIDFPQEGDPPTRQRR